MAQNMVKISSNWIHQFKMHRQLSRDLDITKLVSFGPTMTPMNFISAGSRGFCSLRLLLKNASRLHVSGTEMVGLAPKWVRLAPNWTNPGLFQIRFQCIWRGAPNALKSDLKKPLICPIWGKSDPL